MKTYVIVLLCLCSLWACKNETQKLAKEMRHVIGQHVIIPDYAEAKVLGESVPIPDSLFKKANILVYTPPLFCTSCNLDCLEEWKTFMNELETVSQIGFVFIFKPKREKELTATLKEFNFDYPVIYDTKNEFIKKNPCISHPVFYVILLDENNCIRLTGNPVGNETLWKLYKQQIKTLLTEE